jgi:hypothetical protein
MSYFFSKNMEQAAKNAATPIKTVGSVSHTANGTRWDNLFENAAFAMKTIE